MTNIFPIDFEEKLTMAQDDYILFSDSEDGNKIKKAQYSNLKGPAGNGIASITSSKSGDTTTVTITETNGTVTTFTLEDGEDGDAKLFTLSGTLDLTNAQASYDWYLAGKYPIIKYGSKFYYLYSASSSTLFWVIPYDKASDSSSTTGLYRDGIKMEVSSGTITTITTTTIFVANSNYLRTGYNYPTAYTPEYNGSPATKKYVDDSISGLGTAAACNTGTSSGNVPVLDSNGKLATTILPGVALTDTFTVSTSSDLTSLSSAEQGDIAIATSENKTYVLSADPYSTAANWKEILSPTGGVTSVNGNTGAVTVSEFTPSGTATTGYVVTKTAGGYEWAAPSGGDVEVSSQANNILTSGTKLRAGTQANYESLGTYDNNTIYLTI